MSTMKKCSVVMLPTNEKARPIDCIGKLFLNNNNVLTKLFNLEDIIKSNSYFGATPMDIYITSDEEIKELC